MSCKWVFAEPNECEPCVVGFDYCHDGRRKVTVEVHVGNMQIRYTSATGIKTPWHGKASEKNEYGQWHQGQARHQITFKDFRSPFGCPQAITFSQVGPITWRGHHRNGDKVVIVLKNPKWFNIVQEAHHARSCPPVITLQNAAPSCADWNLIP